MPTPDDPGISAKPTPVQRAKDALLNALDQLERAESELGTDAERVHLVVTYEVGALEPDGAWHSIGGWASTPGSKWEHAALLRRAAEAQAESDHPYAEDFDDDGPDD